MSNVPTFHLNVLPRLFWQTFPANLFCLKLNRNIFPLISFFGILHAGYITSVLGHLFLFFFAPFFLPWSADSKKIASLLLNLFLKRGFFLCFFVLAARQPTPTILKNRASSHQIIIFIHVVFVLVGPVIYSF